jgi:hypothetical protein
VAVIALAEWKTYRGYPSAGTAYDATVTALIPQVQAEMERYCGCDSFDSATYTDQAYDGTGTKSLYLRNWPVTTLTSVKTLDGAGTSTTLASTEYRAAVGDNSNGRLTRLSGSSSYWPDNTPALSNGPCWPVGSENILVTYTAGYSTIPGDLKLAAFCLLDTRLQERGISIEVASEGMGNQNRTVRTVAELMARYEVLIGPFRRVVL